MYKYTVNIILVNFNHYCLCYPINWDKMFIVNVKTSVAYNIWIVRDNLYNERVLFALTNTKSLLFFYTGDGDVEFHPRVEKWW